MLRRRTVATAASAAASAVRPTRTKATHSNSNPLEILQQRFARGEIDTAEFEEKRRLITNA